MRAVISEPERRAASMITTPTDNPEISRLRRGKSCARGSQASGISLKSTPCSRMLCGERDMLGRIDMVMTAGEHGDGSGGDARAMRRRVDAAREARHDHKTGFAEFAREPFGEFHAGRRRIARADNGDHRQRERCELRRARR